MSGLRIADRWFERKRVDGGITWLWEPHVDPLLRCNIWHVPGRDSDLLVDTGMGIAPLAEEIADLVDKPLVAVATHYHYDHVGGLHEFDTRVIHTLEAPLMDPYQDFGSLMRSDFPKEMLDSLAEAGYPIENEILVDARPHGDFDPAAYEVPPARPTREVVEGDVVDLGDRHFEVLHLPGHSPGSIGLWDASAGILFSGDAIYDGPLLDELPDSNVDDYIRSMKRLRELPVEIVHGGHDPSFGRERLVELADAYLARRERKGA